MGKVFYCEVFYHYENIPKILQKIMRKWYMKNRHEAVLIFHKYIDLVNKEWSLTGEPCSFGEYLEDMPTLKALMNLSYALRCNIEELTPFIQLID